MGNDKPIRHARAARGLSMGFLLAFLTLMGPVRAEELLETSPFHDANHDPNGGEPQADPPAPARPPAAARKPHMPAPARPAAVARKPHMPALRPSAAAAKKGPKTPFPKLPPSPPAAVAQGPTTLFPGLQPPWRAQVKDWRKQLYDNYGITFGASYQQLFQWASKTVPSAPTDTALGGWAAASVTWAALDRDGPNQGTLVARFGWRDSIGDNAVPAQFGVGYLGAIWSNYEWTSWNGHVRVEDLFWEQKLGGDRFLVRVGNLGPQSLFNFFRFKDARTSFTASPLAFGETIPYPTFGLGTAFRSRPIPGSGLYFVGTLNDMNGDPAANGLDWSTFGLGQYFYGLEIGNDWRRENGEFDHLHLDLFYADKRSTRNPSTSLNTAGGGFKIAGEKQLGNLVGFASYTYNTAEGGGISATLAGQTAVAGISYLRPFGNSGEASIAGMWSQILPSLQPSGSSRKDQFGIDAYWNIGLTPNSTLTPGIQLIFNPVLNPGTDFVAVPSIKFRVFF